MGNFNIENIHIGTSTDLSKMYQKCNGKVTIYIYMYMSVWSDSFKLWLMKFVLK